MPSDLLPLPSPPRRVLSAEEGAFIIELEDHVAWIRRNSSILEEVCSPETKGERLLWPVGLKKCVMLGPKGALKVYDGGKVIQTRGGVLLEDEELVGTMDGGNHGAVVLAGRMAGEALQLATVEYRFVWGGAGLESLGRTHPALKRRPLTWGVYPRAKRVFALMAEPGGEIIRVMRLDKEEAVDLERPRNLEQKEITGLSIEPATGRIAATVRWNKGTEIGEITADGRSYMPLSGGMEAERFDQPAWSPDGTQLLFRRTLADAAALAVMAANAKLTRPVCPVTDGDEWLWIDPQTIAVVKWDKIERREISSFAPGPAKTEQL